MLNLLKKLKFNLKKVFDFRTLKQLNVDFTDELEKFKKELENEKGEIK